MGWCSSSATDREDNRALPVVVPFAEDVFTWPSDRPQLIGCKCANCSVVFFPEQSACGRCGSTAVDRHLLPTTGTVYSWTSQEFLPPPPYAGGENRDTFQPMGIGLIDLEGEVMVEARLTECDPERIHIGDRVEMTIVPFRSDDDKDVVTFAFKPV
jgi:uncharacterized protein